ncbi:hypothetical protein CYMTET_20997 [Cymbomonas tetramitiformis]|uniref:Uncharacterized protein n=1 Tax=Cymbomonas tetramitiformis TaxID=36881 RepID=A0AAE0G306_9CHLO|nr:hypothetical protein CYMTET_20997 [Cymbomonas tetramitiformis]
MVQSLVPLFLDAPAFGALQRWLLCGRPQVYDLQALVNGTNGYGDVRKSSTGRLLLRLLQHQAFVTALMPAVVPCDDMNVNPFTTIDPQSGFCQALMHGSDRVPQRLQDFFQKDDLARTPDVVQAFYEDDNALRQYLEALGLVLELAKLVAHFKEAKDMAGVGGDLLTYQASHHTFSALLVLFKEVSQRLQGKLNFLLRFADEYRLAQHMGYNTSAWLDNYNRWRKSYRTELLGSFRHCEKLVATVQERMSQPFSTEQARAGLHRFQQGIAETAARLEDMFGVRTVQSSLLAAGTLGASERAAGALLPPSVSIESGEVSEPMDDEEAAVGSMAATDNAVNNSSDCGRRCSELGRLIQQVATKAASADSPLAVGVPVGLTPETPKPRGRSPLSYDTPASTPSPRRKVKEKKKSTSSPFKFLCGFASSPVKGEQEDFDDDPGTPQPDAEAEVDMSGLPETEGALSRMQKRVPTFGHSQAVSAMLNEDETAAVVAAYKSIHGENDVQEAPAFTFYPLVGVLQKAECSPQAISLAVTLLAQAPPLPFASLSTRQSPHTALSLSLSASMHSAAHPQDTSKSSLTAPHPAPQSVSQQAKEQLEVLARRINRTLEKAVEALNVRGGSAKPLWLREASAEEVLELSESAAVTVSGCMSHTGEARKGLLNALTLERGADGDPFQLLHAISNFSPGLENLMSSIVYELTKCAAQHIQSWKDTGASELLYRFVMSDGRQTRIPALHALFSLSKRRLLCVSCIPNAVELLKRLVYLANFEDQETVHCMCFRVMLTIMEGLEQSEMMDLVLQVNWPLDLMIQSISKSKTLAPCALTLMDMLVVLTNGHVISSTESVGRLLDLVDTCSQHSERVWTILSSALTTESHGLLHHSTLQRIMQMMGKCERPELAWKVLSRCCAAADDGEIECCMADLAELMDDLCFLRRVTVWEIMSQIVITRGPHIKEAVKFLIGVFLKELDTQAQTAGACQETNSTSKQNQRLLAQGISMHSARILVHLSQFADCRNKMLSMDAVPVCAKALDMHQADPALMAELLALLANLLAYAQHPPPDLAEDILGSCIKVFLQISNLLEQPKGSSPVNHGLLWKMVTSSIALLNQVSRARPDLVTERMPLHPLILIVQMDKMDSSGENVDLHLQVAGVLRNMMYTGDTGTRRVMYHIECLKSLYQCALDVSVHVTQRETLQLLMLQMLQRMTEYLQEEEVPPATDLVDSLFCVTCQDFMRSGLVAPSAKVKAQAVQLLVHITCYHTSFAMELVSLYSSPAHLTPIRGERPNDRRERCGLPGLVLDILEDSSQSMQVEELQVLQWCTYLIIEVVKRAREQGWQLSQAVSTNVSLEVDLVGPYGKPLIRCADEEAETDSSERDSSIVGPQRDAGHVHPCA